MRLIVIIMILAALFALTATIGAIVVGSRSFDGTVVDKPYETGLAWDDIRKNRERLGWNVMLANTSFKTGRNDLLVFVTDKDGAPLPNASAVIAVTRPSTRSLDKSYTTTELPGGRFSATVDFPKLGNWQITITITHGKERADFEKSVYAEQEAS